MARYTGKDGNVTFSGMNEHVKQWDLTDECDIGKYLDAGTVAGGNLYEGSTEGAHRWSGTFVVNADDGPSVSGQVDGVST